MIQNCLSSGTLSLNYTMTWLLLRAIGLTVTGSVYQEIYSIDQTVIEQTTDEEQRNYVAEQEEIIIEDYFLFLQKIGKINYARGCAWDSTPPSRDHVNQKRVRCWSKSFDCAWLIKSYGVEKGIIKNTEIWLYNSQSLMELAEKKDWMVARRWDRTSWTSISWTHFAIVSRDYEWDGILRVFDNANGPNLNQLKERPLRVRYSQGNFIYLGKRVIQIYTNWYVDQAKKNNIHVDRRIDGYEEFNPLEFSVTIKGYDYDSLANRIASKIYDYNQDIDAIATFIAESHLNPEAVGSKWEKWICQLLPLRTNMIRIQDPRWSDRERQTQMCIEKWDAVPKENLPKIWAGYKVKEKYKDMIIIMDK